LCTSFELINGARALDRGARERRRTVNEEIRRRRLAGGLAVLVAALITVSCASARPMADSKVGQADRAVVDAQQAGATANASMELTTAQNKLKDAQAAIAKRDYEEAIKLADQSTVDADYARAKSINQRTNKAIEEMKQNQQVLRQELERLPQ
jgi:Domain of unknown function (DUF4398)